MSSTVKSADAAFGKSVCFCEPNGDTAARARILTEPYDIVGRAAKFHRLYPACIGCSVYGRRPGLGNLGINPGIFASAVKKLGFAQVDEELIEAEGFEPKDAAQINLLCLMTPKSGLQLSGPNYLLAKPYVPRMYMMVTKWFLIHSMRRIEARMRERKLCFHTGSGQVFSHEEFTPFTLNLNNKNLEEILAQQPGVYLAKPARGSMGQGQQLVRIHADTVQEDLLNFLLTSQFLEKRRSEVILQRYIDRPLVVDKRKFDMRVYMLVVNARRDPPQGATAPAEGYYVFMHPGFLRLCAAPYHRDHTDLAVHLTNQHIQARLTGNFSKVKEVTTWYPDELNDYLNKRRRLPRQNWARDVLYPKVGAILGYMSEVFHRHLSDHACKSNTFRILGVDFLVDEQLRVYLLEFNSHPSWSRQTSVLNKLKPSLWREAACLTTEVVVRHRLGRPVRDDCLATRQNFDLVYSSEDPSLARDRIAKMFD